MTLSIKDIREGTIPTPDADKHTITDQPRRLMAAYITPEMLVDLMKHNVTVRIESRIPPDAKVVGGQFDPQRNAYAIMLEHESFEEVPVGQIVPQLASACVFHTVMEPEMTIDGVLPVLSGGHMVIGIEKVYCLSCNGHGKRLGQNAPEECPLCKGWGHIFRSWEPKPDHHYAASTDSAEDEIIYERKQTDPPPSTDERTA